MKRQNVLLAAIAITLSMTVFAGAAHAQSLRTGDNVTVRKDEVVNSRLVATGNNIRIEGKVDGDVFCAGQTVTISGDVTGDVFCAGQTVTVSGKVEGSVRIAGQTVTLSGDVANNVSLAGQQVSLESSASVGQDLTIGASNAVINGVVKRDADIAAETSSIGGQIGRNVGGKYGTLTIASGANIANNVNFSSNKELQKESDTRIGGKIKRKDIPKPQHKPVLNRFSTFIYMFVSLMIVSLTLVLLFPTLFKRTDEQIMKNTGRTSARGLLVLFAAPLLLIGLAITLVGIPLAGLVFVGWMMTLMLSGPIVAHYIGTKLYRTSPNQFMTMLVGSLILLSLYAVPIVNAIVAVCVGVLGSGALLGSLSRARTTVKKSK